MSPCIIKKVVIFGSTGNTGIATVQAAMQHGYDVTMFVRDPQKCPANIVPNAIYQGDVLNKDDVDKAVSGQDGVIIVIGTRNDTSPTTMMSEGVKNILASMQKFGVKRVSCCISSFLFWDRAKVPQRFVPLTEDHERMFLALKESDREWIAVFPPHITEEPARGDYLMKNDSPVGKFISKYDLADILVKCLTDDDRIRHSVGIGYAQ